MATVGQAAGPGPGPRPRLTDLRVSRGRVFHCFPGPGTERKLGSDGHKPDHGAGKISPLPHFLSRRRSERGKREKVGADAPRPPSCSLPVNAPERKVTGPLVVSWAGIFLVLCGTGVFVGSLLMGTGGSPSELLWPFNTVKWVRRGNSALSSSLKVGFFFLWV